MEHKVDKNKESTNPKPSPTPQLEEDPSTEEEPNQSIQSSGSSTLSTNNLIEDTPKEQTKEKEQAKEKLYYRIGEAAKLLNVEKHVIRYWEKEFEIDTHRSSSGQRLYRKVEIETLQKIKSLIYDEGYTIQGAKKFLSPQPIDQTVEPESKIKQNTVYREFLKEIKRELLDVQSILKSL